VRTPPEDLDVDELAVLLADAWRFPTTELRYAPVGFGSHHWVATDPTGALRFVTVDDLGQNPGAASGARLAWLHQAFRTAHALRNEARLPFVVAPIRSSDGSVLRPVDARYVATIFPFVDGRPYPEGEDATPADRAAVVAAVAQLHAAIAAAQPFARADDLELIGRDDLERALGRLKSPWTTGPFAEATRDLLVANKADVRALLKRYDELADRVRTHAVPWVITHGEPKPDNFLATDAGPMLIDWDTTLVAPAARDLWMLDGPTDNNLARYTDLTGRTVGRDELTFYRLRWDLADIASFVAWFAAPHVRTADAEVAWTALMSTLRLQEHWPELL